jgi:hypothetical protein
MIAMAEAAFNKMDSFLQQLNLKSRKKLVKRYIWSIAFMVLKLGHFGK